MANGDTRSISRLRLSHESGRTIDSDDDDAHLARLAAERNPRAAALVWDRFSPLVRRIVVRSMGARADVDDVVQDVFLRFFQRASTLRDPAALRPFIVTITTSVLVSELRRRRVRRWLGFVTADGELPESSSTRDGEAQQEQRDLVAQVYAVLARCKDEDRMAFVLRTLEGLELPEVAAALKTSVATVKRRVSRVHERLHEMAWKDPALAASLGLTEQERRR